MKRFIVAVATNYYSADLGARTVTRYYTAHASSKAVAAKRVMLNVAAADEVWTENNAELRYSTLIFAETLTKRKIRALDKGFESCICDRIDARTKLSFGLITYDEYKAVDKMDDIFRAVLDAIEH